MSVPEADSAALAAPTGSRSASGTSGTDAPVIVARLTSSMPFGPHARPAGRSGIVASVMIGPPSIETFLISLASTNATQLPSAEKQGVRYADPTAVNGRLVNWSVGRSQRMLPPERGV